MSRFAPPQACRCQSCAGYFSRRGIASFNDFGATRWSDGFINIWIFAGDKSFGRCPVCNALVWVADCATQTVIPSRPRPISTVKRLLARITGDRQGLLAAEQAWIDCPAEIRDCDPMVTPGLDDYREAISAEPLSPEREIYVRERILWRSNDHQRNGNADESGSQPRISSAEREQNLIALDALFTELGDERDWCLHGEVLRLLGRFDEALTTLARETTNPERAAMISRFARQGSNEVQVVWRSEFPF